MDLDDPYGCELSDDSLSSSSSSLSGDVYASADRLLLETQGKPSALENESPHLSADTETPRSLSSDSDAGPRSPEDDSDSDEEALVHNSVDLSSTSEKTTPAENSLHVCNSGADKAIPTGMATATLQTSSPVLSSASEVSLVNNTINNPSLSSTSAQDDEGPLDTSSAEKSSQPSPVLSSASDGNDPSPRSLSVPVEKEDDRSLGTPAPGTKLKQSSAVTAKIVDRSDGASESSDKEASTPSSPDEAAYIESLKEAEQTREKRGQQEKERRNRQEKEAQKRLEVINQERRNGLMRDTLQQYSSIRFRFPPLHEAARANDVQGVEVLLEGGLDPCLKSHGSTALHRAAMCADNPRIVRLLVNSVKGKQREALLNAKSSSGSTALVLAAQNNKVKCVRALLRLKAKKDLTTNLVVTATDGVQGGLTALDFAYENKSHECQELLQGDTKKKNAAYVRKCLDRVYAVFSKALKSHANHQRKKLTKSERWKRGKAEMANMVEKLPTEKSKAGEAARAKMFRAFDPNGNGYLSLAEIDKGVMDLFGRGDIFRSKKAIMRAYQAARAVSPNLTKESQDYVERSEFRVLLVYLKQYFELFLMFDRVDTGDDSRINLSEFTDAFAQVESRWGVHVENVEAEFNSIDKNGGGQVLFDEFCEWALSKKLAIDKYSSDEKSNDGSEPAPLHTDNLPMIPQPPSSQRPDGVKRQVRRSRPLPQIRPSLESTTDEAQSIKAKPLPKGAPTLGTDCMEFRQLVAESPGEVYAVAESLVEGVGGDLDALKETSQWCRVLGDGIGQPSAYDWCDLLDAMAQIIDTAMHARLEGKWDHRYNASS